MAVPRYRRSGRYPAARRRLPGVTLLCVLGLGIGFTFLRTCLNLAIFEVSAELGRTSASLNALVTKVDALRVEIERATALAHLAPRAGLVGLQPAAPEAVMLLAASPGQVGGTEHTRLVERLPGRVGPLARLVQHAASLTRVGEARAEPLRHRHRPRSGAQDGGRARCEACRSPAVTGSAGAIHQPLHTNARSPARPGGGER